MTHMAVEHSRVKLTVRREIPASSQAANDTVLA